ncbi:hypothetical protein IW140_002797 [Coemansia sp. RSA 1813]|nr:hypothetical protein EV178_005462 [Coemansia sp. RSA 1646]KAJ1770278.1 hypothetical protein LPJ74_003339 [Coemansia sp. RSA 1843]KAJ2087539.1 hypothetical protein IW138_004909 [Coemansia sp. RSA 986]KAJ2211494.1 hypothetical protein EV179_005437 [Coemansia sp. RSA 487]KAJ2569909.1 hypothetical protein IW140_002797 [Coemansia sp. RSA 1813]
MSDKGKQADTSSSQQQNGSAPTDFQDSAFQAVMPVISDLLERGTRAFALANWEEAIESFGELSSITEQTFGGESQRYADCLVMYGRALLQHAVEQSALLAQKALADAAAGGGGASKDNEGEQNGVGIAEKDDSALSKKANFSFEGEPDFRQVEDLNREEKTNGKSDASAAASSSKGKEKAVDEQQDDDQGEDEEDEDEEDQDDDFAAAWDVLDVARVIQAKSTDRKSRLKYAETLMLLGDVSMESENFAQAVNDFTEALEVKQQYLGDDSRELAELYYKVALAHEYNRDTAKALELMADVQRILGNRIKSLENSSGAEDKEEAGTLEDVLADVAGKIEEWKSPQKPVDLNTLSSEEAALAEKAKAMFKQALESGNINDISGLIKKKEKGKESGSGSGSGSGADDGKRKPSANQADDAKRIRTD